MASRSIAAEIGQLSRQRFGKAARLFYQSAALEVCSVIVSFILLLFSVDGDAGKVGGALVVATLLVAHGLRHKFGVIYNSAETMRRQAVLTEALAWPIPLMSASEWMRLAGMKEANRALEVPIPDTYYASHESAGAKRLAEMTAESAFYSRHLYGKVLPWLTAVLATCVILVLTGFVVVGLRSTSSQIDTVIVQTIYLMVPLLVGLDLFGWWRKVEALIDETATIENQIDAMQEFDVPTVLRIVMEYNCLVVGGFPILDSMFFHWQEEIQRFWSIHQDRRSI